MSASCMPTSSSTVARWSVIRLIRPLAQFDSAVAIDPDLEQMPAYDHLFYGYLRLGRRAQADSTLGTRLSITALGGAGGYCSVGRFLKFAYDERFRPWRASVKRWYVGLTADSTTMESMNRFCRLGYLLRYSRMHNWPSARSWRGTGWIRDTRGRMVTGRRDWRSMSLGRPLAALPQLDTAAFMWNRPDGLVERAEWRVIPAILVSRGFGRAARVAAWLWLRTVAGHTDAMGTRALWALAVDAESSGDTVAAL